MSERVVRIPFRRTVSIALVAVMTGTTERSAAVLSKCGLLDDGAVTTVNVRATQLEVPHAAELSVPSRVFSPVWHWQRTNRTPRPVSLRALKATQKRALQRPSGFYSGDVFVRRPKKPLLGACTALPISKVEVLKSPSSTLACDGLQWASENPECVQLVCSLCANGSGRIT